MFAIKATRWSAACAILLACGTAHAYTFQTPSDWQVEWDNTATYNLGVRAQNPNPSIANNPIFQASDHKFGSAGDVVTNRVSLLSELNVIYATNYGFRVSASGWDDFAYNDTVNTAPGNFAPGLPYSSISSYAGNRYTSYTSKYYSSGAQLLDAFVFANPTIGDVPVYLKVGQLTQYWGNALFFGFQGISYSQGSIDGIKGASAPGTQVKELFIPRKQIALDIQPRSDLDIGLQYALGFDANRLPEGGTFLGPADFLFNGPNQFFLGAAPSPNGFVPFLLPAGTTTKPSGTHGNYGVKVEWSPAWLAGTAGLYYRRFDETQPWAPLFDFGAAGPTDYHLAYNRGVQLFGAALNKTIGNVSAGFEVSYRKGTALNSTPNPAVPIESEGAKGNSLNVIANAIVPLGTTPLYNSATLLAEMAYTRLLSVTSNAALYNGEGYQGCGPGQDRWDGCSTRDAVAMAFVFTPTWQQVFPGVDLSMPISCTFGVKGNAATLAGGSPQGSYNYSVGLNATVRGKYTVALAYNGSYARSKGYTLGPNGQSYYAGGNGPFALNDRSWVSLTLQAGF